MTFLQIQYFIEVCRTGSTLKASQALNVSQSTISSAIKTLEEELGAALFDRTSKGMTPNAAGRLFLIRGKEIVQKITALSAEMEQFSDRKRPIRLGIPVQLNFMYWSCTGTVQILFEFPEPGSTSVHDRTAHESFCRGSNAMFAWTAVVRPLRRRIKLPAALRPAFDPDPVPAEKYRRRLPAQGHYPFFYPDLVSIPIAEETGPFTTYLVWSPNGALARAPKRLFSVFKNYFDRLAAPTQPPPAGPEA